MEGRNNRDLSAFLNRDWNIFRLFRAEIYKHLLTYLPSTNPFACTECSVIKFSLLLT